MLAANRPYKDNIHWGLALSHGTEMFFLAFSKKNSKIVGSFFKRCQKSKFCLFFWADLVRIFKTHKF